MTNIGIFGFTNADLQRLTNRKYDATNCLKNTMLMQLGDWFCITAKLSSGAESDSDYKKREGYLECQKNFAENDLVELVQGSGKSESLLFTKVYGK